MRKYLIIIALLAAALVKTEAQAPLLGPDDALAFDYADATYAEYSVTRFEVSWDGSSTWAVPTLSTRVVTTGVTTYVTVPPFTNGSHSASFRACNLVGCGGGSDPFTFGYAASSAPAVVPSNIRVVKR